MGPIGWIQASRQDSDRKMGMSRAAECEADDQVAFSRECTRTCASRDPVVLAATSL